MEGQGANSDPSLTERCGRWPSVLFVLDPPPKKNNSLPFHLFTYSFFTSKELLENQPMPFGQLVVGPPGSGKTTYCAGLQQFFKATERQCAIINLDPANDNIVAYECTVDVRDLVSLEAVQERLGLGPNGGLIHCIDYLEANLDWLEEKIQPFLDGGAYIVFDCPGQVELFTMHQGMRRIIDAIQEKWHVRLVAVHLVDSHLCTDPGKYMAALLQSLSTMLHLELPQVNVLSKFDTVLNFDPLPFNPDFYLHAQRLSDLVDDATEHQTLGLTLPPAFARLTRSLCEVVEDYGLLQFMPLAIEDAVSLGRLVALCDKANGYAFAGLAKPGGIAPELQYGAGLDGVGSESAEELLSRLRLRRKLSPEGQGADNLT